MKFESSSELFDQIYYDSMKEVPKPEDPKFFTDRVFLLGNEEEFLLKNHPKFFTYSSKVESDFTIFGYKVWVVSKDHYYQLLLTFEYDLLQGEFNEYE